MSQDNAVFLKNKTETQRKRLEIPIYVPKQHFFDVYKMISLANEIKNQGASKMFVKREV